LTANFSSAIIPPFSANSFEENSRFATGVDPGTTWQGKENADIAQLVEQVIRNDQVVGSNPTIG
jgi:hypothetical protein